MSLAESIEALEKQVSEFRQLMQEKEDLRLSRQSLAKTIEEFIEKTESIKMQLLEVEKNAKLENSTISAEKPIQEITSLIVFLKRNLQFENDKIQRLNPFNEISEKNEIPEVFFAIEEKTKKTLLSLAYFIEKSTLSLHSEKPSFSVSKPAQQVLQLLKAKDAELEELKKKYNSLIAQGLLARIEEKTSADFEESLNATATRLEVANSELQKIALENKGSIEKIEKSQAALEQKIRQIDELLSKFQSKSLETITVLKKERDAAKKFALDLEHETSALRQTYSKELLNLQDYKMQLQKELQQQFVQKTKSLETELKQKSEFLEHFKKLTEEKEAKIRALKEKLEHQKAILQHYAKHDSIKKRHAIKAKNKINQK